MKRSLEFEYPSDCFGGTCCRSLQGTVVVRIDSHFSYLLGVSQWNSGDSLRLVRTRAYVAIQVERLVSGDMSQRHETAIHPSTYYVKLSQEEVLLTCAA
jgi:hypothetical protein